MDERALDILRYESAARSNWDDSIGQSRLSAAIEAKEMNLVGILNPKIYKDGNKWCVLYGENIQDGVCGFGDTPREAILDFNKAWDENA